MIDQTTNDLFRNDPNEVRCALPTCRKKLGLNQFECRCKHIYCIKHYHSFDHNCQFDHKKLYREKWEKENPRITKDKIEKI